jgi:hypothetical protein
MIILQFYYHFKLHTFCDWYSLLVCFPRYAGELSGIFSAAVQCDRDQAGSFSITVYLQLMFSGSGYSFDSDGCRLAAFLCCSCEMSLLCYMIVV